MEDMLKDFFLQYFQNKVNICNASRTKWDILYNLKKKIECFTPFNSNHLSRKLRPSSRTIEADPLVPNGQNSGWGQIWGYRLLSRIRLTLSWLCPKRGQTIKYQYQDNYWAKNYVSVEWKVARFVYLIFRWVKKERKYLCYSTESRYLFWWYHLFILDFCTQEKILGKK